MRTRVPLWRIVLGILSGCAGVVCALWGLLVFVGWLHGVVSAVFHGKQVLSGPAMVFGPFVLWIVLMLAVVFAGLCFRLLKIEPWKRLFKKS